MLRVKDKALLVPALGRGMRWTVAEVYCRSSRVPDPGIPSPKEYLKATHDQRQWLSMLSVASKQVCETWMGFARVWQNIVFKVGGGRTAVEEMQAAFDAANE